MALGNGKNENADGEMTSEEKLLKLIRSKDKSKDAKEMALHQGRKILKSAQRSSIPKKDIHFLPLANRLLIILIINIIIYIFVRYLFVDQKEALNLSLGFEKIERPAGLPELSLKQQRPFSFYREEIQKRDIFQSPWERPKEKTLGAESRIPDFVKKIKLLGIVLDGDPKAIVEDMETKQTLFMSEGESIRDAVLQEIQESKVIFILNDEKVELTQ